MAMTSSPEQLGVRRRILDATLDVIAADGLDAVRHRRVAELAGVSLGSTTYHFASRDDLIEAAFQLYLDGATEFLERLEVPTTRGDDLAAAIVDYVDRLLTAEFADTATVQAEYELVLYAARSPRIAQRLHEWEAAQCERFERVLDGAGAADASLGARTLLALVRGLEIERLTSGAPIEDLHARLEPVVRGLLNR
jgi:DNA-binding transcriptional regulator YbjK